jgi:hypothetical protein
VLSKNIKLSSKGSKPDVDQASILPPVNQLVIFVKDILSIAPTKENALFP